MPTEPDKKPGAHRGKWNEEERMPWPDEEERMPWPDEYFEVQTPPLRCSLWRADEMPEKISSRPGHY